MIGKVLDMRRIRPLIDPRVLAPARSALALELLTAFFGLRHSMRRDFSEFFDLIAALPPEHPQCLARLRDKKGSREN